VAALVALGAAPAGADQATRDATLLALTAAVDGYTTASALRHGACEGDPLARGLETRSAPRDILVNAAIGFAAGKLLRHTRALVVGASGVELALGAWNEHELSRAAPDWAHGICR